MLCEWKAKQKGLPSPESEDDQSPANGTPPPTGRPPEAVLPTGAPTAPVPSGQLQPGRPCPPSRLHPPDGPHPPNRPCSSEVHPSERPLLPGRPHAPGRLHSPTVPRSAMENVGMTGGQGLLIRYQLFSTSQQEEGGKIKMYFYPVEMLKTDTFTWNCVKMLILIIC